MAKFDVDFVEPLKGLYSDPVSAGAAILSRYLDDPLGVGRTIASEPERFGTLVPHSTLSAKAIAARLQNPSSGISLRQCAALFAAARDASAELDVLRAENPEGFGVLQLQRAFERRMLADITASPDTLAQCAMRGERLHGHLTAGDVTPHRALMGQLTGLGLRKWHEPST